MFTNYPPEKIDGSFITLHDVMNKVIDNFGGNDYTLGHVGKQNKKGCSVSDHMIGIKKVKSNRFGPICLMVTGTARLWDGDGNSWSKYNPGIEANYKMD